MTWKFVEKLEQPDNINVVEDRFGIRLPKDYTDAVREYNHGTPYPNTFDTENLKGRSFGELLDFNLNKQYNIISEYELIKDRLPPRVYPITGDAGGNYVCFDYRKSDTNPEVVFWDHEQIFEIEDDELVVKDSEHEYERYRLEFIASSFTESLDVLYEPGGDDDDEDAEILYDGMDDE